MAKRPERKTQERKFATRALALYAAGVIVIVLGAYGFGVSNLVTRQGEAERARDAVRTGRMVFTSPDRIECRSYRFDNQTAQLGVETVGDCDGQRATTTTRSGSGAFGTISDGFNQR
jgi:hypothetical protein